MALPQPIAIRSTLEHWNLFLKEGQSTRTQGHQYMWLKKANLCLPIAGMSTGIHRDDHRDHEIPITGMRGGGLTPQATISYPCRAPNQYHTPEYSDVWMCVPESQHSPEQQKGNVVHFFLMIFWKKIPPNPLCSRLSNDIEIISYPWQLQEVHNGSCRRDRVPVLKRYRERRSRCKVTW